MTGQTYSAWWLPAGAQAPEGAIMLAPPDPPAPPAPQPTPDPSVDPGWCNVTRAPYNAKLDGAALNDAAFAKAASDCMKGQFGGTLFIPPGRGQLSQGLLLQVSNAPHPDGPGTLCIRGAGVGASILAANTPGPAGATIAVRGQQAVSMSDFIVYAPQGGECIRLTNSTDDASPANPDNAFSVLQNMWLKYGLRGLVARRATSWVGDKLFLIGQSDRGLSAENLFNVDGGGGTLSRSVIDGAVDAIWLNVSGVFLDNLTAIGCKNGVRIVAKKTVINANITQITLTALQLSGALDKALIIDGTDPMNRCLVAGVWATGGQWDANASAVDLNHGDPDGIQQVSLSGVGLRSLVSGPVLRFNNVKELTVTGGHLCGIINNGRDSLPLIGGINGHAVVIDGPGVAVPTNPTVLFPGSGYMVKNLHPLTGLPWAMVNAAMAPDDTSEYWCPNVKGPQDTGYAPGRPSTIASATGAQLRRSGGAWVA